MLHTLGGSGFLAFTPTPGFVGTGSFTYTLTDGHGLSATGSVTVDVTNATPTAPDAALTILHDTPVLINPKDGSSDGDGDELTAAPATGPYQGAIALFPGYDDLWTYTPAAGWTDTEDVFFTLTDGTATITRKYTITVTDQPPVAPDQAFSGPHDLGAAGWITGWSEPDEEPVTIAALTQPENGTLTLNQYGYFEYTPTDASYIGIDAFQKLFQKGSRP